MGFTVYCGHLKLGDRTMYKIDHFKVPSSDFTIFRKGILNLLRHQLPEFYNNIDSLNDYSTKVVDFPISKRPFSLLLLSSDIEGNFHHRIDSLELSYNFRDYANPAGLILNSDCLKQYIEWWKVFSFSAQNKLDISYK